MAAPPSVPEVDGGHDEGQRQHDSLVDCLVLEDVPLVLAGIPMEHMSLTTLTWLRRVNSLFATGTKPEDETSLMREVGLFILAHRKDVPLKTRSKLFHLGEALDDAVEEVLHSIPLRKAKVLFDQILHYVTAETSTLATPDRKEGAEQEGNG